jgi:hypothetical protein
METKKNKDLLIQELQNEVNILKEVMTNQATIIGIKDMIIYRFKEQVDQLESENQKLINQSKSLFWSFNRSN